MEIQIGQQAPDFALYDTEKKLVKLSDYRGSTVLLLFFPLAFTSVCTAELCSVRDNLAMYEGLEVAPLGISVDSLYTLKKFKEEQKLNFPLLSDFNKQVSKLYHSLYETFSYGMSGVSKRSAFLIDTQGVIQYFEILENAGLQPNFVMLKEKAGALRKAS